MQYLLKIVPLGVEELVMRTVSLEGGADISHVLDLCSLSFAYANYQDKKLIFAQDDTSFEAFKIDVDSYDDNRLGPSAISNSADNYWQKTIDLSALKVDIIDAKNNMEHFDQLIEKYRQGQIDAHPQENVQYKFMLIINNVQHLVTIMMASDKLNCFIPATLMGCGIIEDNEGQLSVDLINACIKKFGEESFNLREATTRMRALGSMRGENSMNSALIASGAKELKFTVKS